MYCGITSCQQKTTVISCSVMASYYVFHNYTHVIYKHLVLNKHYDHLNIRSGIMYKYGTQLVSTYIKANFVQTCEHIQDSYHDKTHTHSFVQQDQLVLLGYYMLSTVHCRIGTSSTGAL